MLALPACIFVKRHCVSHIAWDTASRSPAFVHLACLQQDFTFGIGETALSVLGDLGQNPIEIRFQVLVAGSDWPTADRAR